MNKEFYGAAQELETIENEEEIREELTEMLKTFDKDMNGYQTDIYAYYDEETHRVSLDTFVNVGGNSWMDDEHITIYRDKEHYESLSDFFNTVDYISFVLNVPAEVFEEKVRERFEYEDGEEIEYWQIWDMIIDNQDYMEELQDYYNYYIECDVDYSYKVDEIMDYLRNRIENEE